MEDLKRIIARNISALRQASRMTQLELAEKLNYSDKAISKWERGESIPDVLVLKSIADLFGVTLDDLLREDHDQKPVVPEPLPELPSCHHRNRWVTTVLSVLLAWFVATVLYVVMDLVIPTSVFKWIPFAWAVPVSMIIWLVFNSIWFNQRRNYGIISLLMWTGVACVILTVACFDFWPWKLLLLGIPGQIAIILWSHYKLKSAHV
jgi:transcriptional regulator with XRE-family HTH domain